MIANEFGVSSAPATPERSSRDQRFVGRSHGTGQRQNAKGTDTEREHAPPAVDVAERPADQNQRAERQQIRVRDPLLRLQAAAEIVLNRRECDVDDRPSIMAMLEPRIAATR
jgi:type IV secretory pathway VirB10-like protein